MEIVHQAAVQTISRVLDGRNLNQVLNQVNANYSNLTAQQRGALQDISFGTLRFYGQLNAILDLLLNKPIHDVQIRILLLVCLYQLRYSRAAPYAIVDFAVNSVRKLNPAASGLVNAVLRNYLRNKESLHEKADQSEVGYYSYPSWWINKIKSQYKELADEILLTGNQHPPMTLRVNRKKTSITEYVNLLSSYGIQSSIVLPGAILLTHPVPVEKLPGFMDGLISVQDAGAQYAVGLLDIKDGMHVLDACAAPGGKCAHLLESAQINLVAIDKDTTRLDKVNDNLKRLQLHGTLLTGDAAHPENWWDGTLFQRILADVPCSASGVVRRHPDIKWLRRESDINKFAKQQLIIINALWKLLANEGKLLYVTCSLFEQENQSVINTFMKENIDAVTLPLNVVELNSGQLLPNETHDGFFYALLQKKI